MGPGISALYSCVPPRPSRGSTATASSMMPSPPISCRKQRQMLTDGASRSSPARVVAPVAVRPLMASKYASVKLMPCTTNSKGSAA